MTYKEAIERLKWYFECDDGGAAENITKIAYQIAIKALELAMEKEDTQINNKDYYFTYGVAGYPYVGGWTRVSAPSRQAAIALFRIYHPDVIEGTLNCEIICDDEEFRRTLMYTNGNFGKYAHEWIYVQRVIVE